MNVDLRRLPRRTGRAVPWGQDRPEVARPRPGRFSTLDQRLLGLPRLAGRPCPDEPPLRGRPGPAPRSAPARGSRPRFSCPSRMSLPTSPRRPAACRATTSTRPGTPPTPALKARPAARTPRPVARSSASIAAASTSCTAIGSIPMSAWSLLRNSAPPSSEAIRTISTSRATPSMSASCGSTRTCPARRPSSRATPAPPTACSPSLNWRPSATSSFPLASCSARSSAAA